MRCIVFTLILALSLDGRGDSVDPFVLFPRITRRSSGLTSLDHAVPACALSAQRRKRLIVLVPMNGRVKSARTV